MLRNHNFSLLSSRIEFTVFQKEHEASMALLGIGEPDGLRCSVEMSPPGICGWALSGIWSRLLAIDGGCVHSGLDGVVVAGPVRIA